MTRAVAAGIAAAALAVVPGGVARVSESGLRGTLFVYPSQPVCTRGTPCTRPAPGLTLAFYRSGKPAARVTTNRAGRYRLLLAAGTYTVQLWRRPAVPVQPSRVVVRSAVRRVDFTYDSGIR
jgi:hypothetical protein